MVAKNLIENNQNKKNFTEKIENENSVFVNFS